MASAFEMPEEKRQAQRDYLLLAARMEFVDGLRDVHLLNIAPLGAKLDCEQSPVLNERVTLVVGGLRVSGAVAWVDGTRFGVAFDKPIDARPLMKDQPAD
jgi:hypothetical protein